MVKAVVSDGALDCRESRYCKHRSQVLVIHLDIYTNGMGRFSCDKYRGLQLPVQRGVSVISGSTNRTSRGARTFPTVDIQKSPHTPLPYN
jgi:hypothetical protein